MFQESQPQQESPLEFHKNMIHTLLHEWKAMPDEIITDQHYADGQEATSTIQKNKFRMAWFNAISQEIPLIDEDHLLPETESTQLTEEAKILGEEAATYFGKPIPGDLVERGDALLSKIENILA